MMIFRPLLLCLMLTACGSGSDDDRPSDSPPVSGATMSLASPSLRTIAGGTPIPINATLSSGGAVRWRLSAGAPGSLSASTGASVRYLPPAGAIATESIVTVTASGDGATASLKLAVTPDPGPPGLRLIAGSGQRLTQDGIGAAASFASPNQLARDRPGNIYVMEYFYIGNAVWPAPRLRKIAPNGAVTTLAAIINGTYTWFGQPDTNGNGASLDGANGMEGDLEGNLYIAVARGHGHTGEIPGRAGAIFKIAPSGDMRLLAGTTEDLHLGVNIKPIDGTGGEARFVRPSLIGGDLDGNLFVFDGTNIPGLGLPLNSHVPRKATSSGVVTTLQAFPAHLNADMNGNTYRFDQATNTIVRTTPEGVTSKEADAPYCDDYPSNVTSTCVTDIIPEGGASYLIISGYRVVRMVVRH
ncbi:hypothetical protein ACFOHT_19785 [Massilia oculi]|uniref:hypothetical protein n=1 Tax=Massilia oculi TaxID=945844 RepID=UPI00361D6066